MVWSAYVFSARTVQLGQSGLSALAVDPWEYGVLAVSRNLGQAAQMGDVPERQQERRGDGGAGHDRTRQHLVLMIGLGERGLRARTPGTACHLRAGRHDDVPGTPPAG